MAEASDPITVWVVAANDYPDSVFTEEADAKAYCNRKTVEQKDPKRGYLPVRVYYRAYPMVVNAKCGEL